MKMYSNITQHPSPEISTTVPSIPEDVSASTTTENENLITTPPSPSSPNSFWTRSIRIDSTTDIPYFTNETSTSTNKSANSTKVLQGYPWPVKKEAIVEGDVIIGGLMMVHEREDSITCGPIMPQGGVQALETMLYTIDQVNDNELLVLPNITLGAHVLDDCDKDTYGLEMAVDFIKGEFQIVQLISAH
ncbi:hypothetical protein JTB14_028263 [Gonioctena quinquepunctata]|nr:hypothetical protein JTB14_028263 [Gonioctena quinquepunctata]